MKLFVFLIIAGVNSSEYCKICPNHTLCKYPFPGPSDTCARYDPSALLKRDDIINIVNRINERRSIVALGLSTRLPTAANMLKISWSEDLAWSAQRWVDQCDQSVHPDKHDQCRKLKDKNVGQNIATILGPAPGVSVKSFVDIWFTQTLDFFGSVSYYNQSENTKTNYFTQLIWSETNFVGCGKAKFYIVSKAVMAERLVCNFSPSGNINGKPIYAIGFPATQCPDYLIPDDTYSGLCTHQSQRSIFTTHIQATSSLLTIFSSSGTSEKRELDPLKDNVIQLDADDNDDHRHQKSRHVISKPQGEFSSFLPLTPKSKSSSSSLKNFHIHHHRPGIEKSQVCRDHKPRDKVIPPYTIANQQNLWFNLTNQSVTFSEAATTRDDYKNSNKGKKCTRYASIPGTFHSRITYEIDFTRRQYNIYETMNPPSIFNTQLPRMVSKAKISQCTCNLGTKFPLTCNSCCYTTSFSHIAFVTSEDTNKDARKSSVKMHYYDLFPNLALRSGELAEYNVPNKTNESNNRRLLILRSPTTPNRIKSKVLTKRKRKSMLNNKQRKTKMMNKEQDDSYSYFDSKRRQKRKSVWQDDKENKPLNINSKMSQRKQYSKREGHYINPLMSYGDLYYQVLSKLTKLWEGKHDKETSDKKNRKCPCNKSYSPWKRTQRAKVLMIFITLNTYRFTH